MRRKQPLLHCPPRCVPKTMSKTAALLPYSWASVIVPLTCPPSAAATARTQSASSCTCLSPFQAFLHPPDSLAFIRHVLTGCRYCECFAARIYCEGCNCLSCMNTPENAEAVQKAVVTTLERNPKAFVNKIQYTGRASPVCFTSLAHCPSFDPPFVQAYMFILIFVSFADKCHHLLPCVLISIG